MKIITLIATIGCLPVMGDVIGIDQFDYPAGLIDARSGGVGWDYDQNTEFDDNGVEPGGDGDMADWDGTANVSAEGTLVTNDTTALRQYNGPSEGADPASEERDGAFRGTGTIYYRVDMTRSASATWGGLSGFDFGGERLFFGVSSASAGTDTIAIQESGVSGTNGDLSLIDADRHRSLESRQRRGQSARRRGKQYRQLHQRPRYRHQPQCPRF